LERDYPINVGHLYTIYICRNSCSEPANIMVSLFLIKQRDKKPCGGVETQPAAKFIKLSATEETKNLEMLSKKSIFN